ncbi:MAG: ion channel [Flavobacterium sp.]
MGFFKKINANAATSDTTGFGTNPSNYGGRFINKDGSANIEKRGMPFFSRVSWYHTMLNMPAWKFILILLGFYAVVNLIFALLYYAIGVEHLNGIDVSGSEWLKFGKAYFFSAQTFTTVGYGHISPKGFLTSALAAAEALTGLLSFAIATGLFYGRFSRPRAYLIFSENALISPFRDGYALMLRTAPHKNTNLIDAEARMTLGMNVTENGIPVNKFYNLPLQIDKIGSLSLSWTIVHPIDEKSPLFGFSANDFAEIDGEVIVYVKAFDDLFSNTVGVSTSYTFSEIVYGAKFEMMYTENDDNTKTIVHLDRINAAKNIL